MSSVLVVAAEPTRGRQVVERVLAQGMSVLLVAAKAAPSSSGFDNWSDVDGGVEWIDSDPLSTIGQGRLGDLLRQRGPFASAVVVMPPANDAGFAATGLDADQHQLQGLSLLVAVTKGLRARVAPAGTRLIVIHSGGSGALAVASSAFIHAFGATAGADALEWIDVDPGADGWQQHLEALLAKQAQRESPTSSRVSTP